MSLSQMPLPVTKPSKVLALATPRIFLLTLGNSRTRTTRLNPFGKHFSPRGNNTHPASNNEVQYSHCQPPFQTPFATTRHPLANYLAQQAAQTPLYSIALPRCRRRTYVPPFCTNFTNLDNLTAAINAPTRKGYIKLMTKNLMIVLKDYTRRWSIKPKKLTARTKVLTRWMQIS